MNKILIIIFSFCACSFTVTSQNTYQFAVLKYGGGGDWYSNLATSLPNLIRFCNQNLGTNINTEQAIVEAGSREIFNYPLVHMTGHGNVIFNSAEAQNLREYMLAGGFLHIDDNYGMDKFIRPEMKKVFPELDLIELPPSHPVFHQKYDFPRGIPKIHEHDNKPPQAFGLIYEGRLVCLYTYETDLGDGWEDAEVHNNPEERRRTALQMGANIVQFVLMNN